jgi:small-conductance mechanosensitive channel
LTVDQVDAILPNKMVINEKILNHTRSPQLRVNVPVGIGYGEDIGAARQALLAAVSGHPQLAEDPAPKVVVKELGDSAVKLELRAWLRDPHKEREVFCDLLELAKVTLDQAGIEMPFPQQTLHLADPEVLERRTGKPGLPP